MRQRQFEQLHQSGWDRMATLLEKLEKRDPKAVSAADSETLGFPKRYRLVCQHLAQARSRGYSQSLVDHLNDLVLSGHHQLYRRNFRPAHMALTFFLAEFPRLVRSEKRFVLAAVALFVIPALVAFIAVRLDPNLVFSLFDPDHVNRFESMYNPSLTHLGRDRAADSDFQMFGWYIFNNISIAFRCFAGGLVLLVGAVVELAVNGMILGGLAAHLQNLDYHQSFYPFLVGHSAFELSAICLAGAAGMRLGAALLAPGNRTRRAALRDAAETGVRLLYGAVCLLLVAAFIEAFWSSDNAIAPAFRLGAGAFLWLSVVLYFCLGGRRHGH